jgi:16S rRNA (guanine(527)-N(7))-methyltransferase RsmG
MPEHPNATEVERIHRELLELWRTAMNLVGPGSAKIHFADSRAVARLIAARGRWADLGSGAGFPGIAIASHNPDAHVHLVESRSKRAAFLQRVVQQAGLPNATVFHGRVQALESGCWDGIISRAFAAPAAVLEHARRLLVPGGRLYLMLAHEQVEAPPDFTLQAHHDYRAGGRERRLTALTYIG